MLKIVNTPHGRGQIIGRYPDGTLLIQLIGKNAPADRRVPGDTGGPFGVYRKEECSLSR